MLKNSFNLLFAGQKLKNVENSKIEVKIAYFCDIFQLIVTEPSLGHVIWLEQGLLTPGELLKKA